MEFLSGVVRVIHFRRSWLVTHLEKEWTMIEIRKPDTKLTKILPPVIPSPGITYIPSQFTLPFEHRGKRYVFNVLTKQCIEGSLPASARAQEGYDDLIRAQFLIPDNRDECAYYNQISALMRAYNRKKGIPGYTILPTFACNARCIYCYEEGMKQVTMTPDIVEQTIRFILDTHEGKKIKIKWFGGEPLLGERTIDRICEALRDAGLEYRSSMISNGSLITPEIVEKMKNDWKLKHIQISMDGAEEDYITRKHYHANHDYYHKVMQAVSLLSKAGITVIIRCNVDEENWERIPRFLDDLKTGVTHKDKASVYFCLLNARRMGPDNVTMWTKIRDARHLIEEAGFHPAPFLGLGLRFRTSHCMADGGSVVIAPEGSLYPCEHCPPKSRFGDIWHGTTDAAARKEFCRVDRTREKCKTCPFLPDCTNFATCPVQETHCREVRELMAIDALKQMVDKKEEAGLEIPIC